MSGLNPRQAETTIRSCPQCLSQVGIRDQKRRRHWLFWSAVLRRPRRPASACSIVSAELVRRSVRIHLRRSRPGDSPRSRRATVARANGRPAQRPVGFALAPDTVPSTRPCELSGCTATVPRQTDRLLPSLEGWIRAEQPQPPQPPEKPAYRAFPRRSFRQIVAGSRRRGRQSAWRAPGQPADHVTDFATAHPTKPADLTAQRGEDRKRTMVNASGSASPGPGHPESADTSARP